MAILPVHDQLAMSRVQVIAHRGNSSVAPENTLAAFGLALDCGATWVELDYHHSADAVPVVIHDETLDRTTNARQVLGRAALPVAARGKPTSRPVSLDANTELQNAVSL